MKSIPCQEITSAARDAGQKEMSFRRMARNAVMGEARRISIGRSSHTASVNCSTPVEIIVDSDSAPRVVGRPYLKTQFSNGRGFAITLYTPSTMRVVVGSDWNPYDSDNH